MRKLTLFVLLGISNIVLVHGQSTTKLSVRESEEYKDEVKSLEVLSLHTGKSGETVIVRNGKNSFLFDIFDTQMKKSFSKVVSSSKKETYVGDLFYDESIKFFTVYAPEKDERILYCYTLDLPSKAFRKTTIFKTTVDKKQSLFGSRNRHKTNFALSPNASYFAIATDNYRRDKNAYTIRVFDAKTNKLVYKKDYQKNDKLSYEHNDLYVDNDGNAYSLGKLFEQTNLYNIPLVGDNYQFVLNKVSPQQNEELLITLDDEYIKSLSISDINDELHLIGFYSEQRANKIKGGCNFIIDTDKLSIKSKKIHTLPKRIYEDLYGARKAERKSDKKKEFKNFYIDYVLRDQEGGTYLIAEEFYITERMTTGSSMSMQSMNTHVSYTYHYDNILILKFNASGDLDWGRSIFKTATEPSYNAFIKNDRLHIILNSGKNLNEKNDGRTKVAKSWLESAALYDIEFSPTGKVDYNKIQNNQGNEFYLPYYGTYGTNQFIMMSDGNRRKTFMILK